MTRKNLWLKLAFGAALILTLAFGVRLGVQAVYWSDPRHQDQSIEGWMRLGYVARSWDVPAEVLGQATGLPPAQTVGQSLSDIAAARDIPLPALIDTLQSAIDAHRQNPAASQ